jgi:hypothetical protein
MEPVTAHKKALLITGTIVPNSIYVEHKDAVARRNEYYQALKFCADQAGGHKLFFLENSEYDIASDKELSALLENKNITLLKFPKSTAFSLGKGYQEFEMLDQAIDQLAGQFDTFVKITGRYRILNLIKFLSLNCDGILADSHKKYGVTQTNFFMVNGRFYKENIAGLYKNADDSKGEFIEKVVYRKIFSDPLFKEHAKLLPFNPAISGVSGSYGGELRRNKMKLFIRNAERRFLKLAGINRFLIEY